MRFANANSQKEAVCETSCRNRVRHGPFWGRFDPDNQCSDLECVPGTEISLGATWTSPDFGGQLSIRGRDYQLGVEAEDGAGGSVTFDGRITMPDFNGSDTADVSAPFTFTGSLTYPDASGVVGTDTSLSGQGTATLTMHVSADGTAWQFVSARYEFAKK